LLKWLVKHGASPDIADHDGVSPKLRARERAAEAGTTLHAFRKRRSRPAQAQLALGAVFPDPIGEGFFSNLPVGAVPSPSNRIRVHLHFAAQFA
jgi:hypothetical protein